MKTLRRFALSLGFSLFVGTCSDLDAADFNFDLTFDGAMVSVDAGSTNPIGVSMPPGDSFVLDLHAAGSDFWRVEAPYDFFVPLTFSVRPAGTRTANVESSFLRKGVEVENITQTGVTQLEVHIGVQDWVLAAGLEFDTVLVNYDLLTSTETTTIQDNPDLFSAFGSADRPFFRSDDISYNEIPEPAALGLLVLGLLGLGCARRR